LELIKGTGKKNKLEKGNRKTGTQLDLGGVFFPLLEKKQRKTGRK